MFFFRQLNHDGFYDVAEQISQAALRQANTNNRSDDLWRMYLDYAHCTAVVPCEPEDTACNTAAHQPQLPQAAEKSDRVILWSDGCCLNNGKTDADLRAGIGIFHQLGSSFNRSESWNPSFGKPTNQRAELIAAILALQIGKEALVFFGAHVLEIRTDSEYVCKGMTSWIHSWKRNGWKTSSKGPVINKDLWEQLDTEAASIKAQVLFTHVDGHTGMWVLFKFGVVTILDEKMKWLMR